MKFNKQRIISLSYEYIKDLQEEGFNCIKYGQSQNDPLVITNDSQNLFIVNLWFLTHFLISDLYPKNKQVKVFAVGTDFCVQENNNGIFINLNNGSYQLPLGYNNFALSNHHIPKNIKKIYCCNCNVKKENNLFSHLPIGILKHNISFLCSTIKENQNLEDKKNLLYINFRYDHHYNNGPMSERKYIYPHFKKFDWVTCKEIVNSKTPEESHSEFYRDVSLSLYTLSPEGMGIDCYRTWEAISLYSIPIVKRSNFTERLNKSNLPILIVDQYKDITKKLLISNADKIKNKFNTESCFNNYWKNIIKNE